MLAPLDVGCLTHTVMGSIANGCWVQLWLFNREWLRGGCPDTARVERGWAVHTVYEAEVYVTM